MTTGSFDVTAVGDRQAEAGRGGRDAVIAVDTKLTYVELQAQINRAGNLLRSLGVRRGERVLLVLDDSSLFPTVFLGAMRIGAVPVPVNPMDRPDNYAYYLDDSYATVVVTDAERFDGLRAAVGQRKVTWVVPGRDGSGVVDLAVGLAAQSQQLDAVPWHVDDPAFWLYSSGSTGRPKGVVHLRHDIPVTCATYGREVLRLAVDDITFSTTKLFHAYGLGNGLSFPFAVGATAVYMSGPTKPDAIVSMLMAHRPTVLFSVPVLFAGVGRHPGASDALKSVRFCVSAGEPLPAVTVNHWQEKFGLEILDGIGSTEMLHIYCSNRHGSIRPGTSGWPVPGYDLRLVGPSGAVLDGEGVGALEVRGGSCGAFYWHQHEKTKRAMLGEWFETGDRYQRDADGVYTYVGREDDMLKVGGLWVSPADMESVLFEHPRVKGVGVVGVTVDDASRIAAYVECIDGGGDDDLAQELRAWCKTRMRRYEYPHLVRFVDALPRTLTGKVQRFKLREWAAQEADPQRPRLGVQPVAR